VRVNGASPSDIALRNGEEAVVSHRELEAIALGAIGSLRKRWKNKILKREIPPGGEFRGNGVTSVTSQCLRVFLYFQRVTGPDFSRSKRRSWPNLSIVVTLVTNQKLDHRKPFLLDLGVGLAKNLSLYFSIPYSSTKFTVRIFGARMPDPF
jgi:hypothetical protein